MDCVGKNFVLVYSIKKHQAYVSCLKAIRQSWHAILKLINHFLLIVIVVQNKTISKRPLL